VGRPFCRKGSGREGREERGRTGAPGRRNHGLGKSEGKRILREGGGKAAGPKIIRKSELEWREREPKVEGSHQE